MPTLDAVPSESADSRPAVVTRNIRRDFLRAIRHAIAEERGFAAGKLGYSEQVWLASNAGQAPADEPRLDRAQRASARFHACAQIGVFPDSDEYLASTATAFAASVASLDYLAVHESPLVDRILRALPTAPRAIGFNDLEPNRDTPYRADDCYLPSLCGRRVLIVTSPANLLAQRATAETFTGVWRNTGCPWFAPASVEALAFPSLFDSATRETSPSSVDLLRGICEDMSSRAFDVALIAAGSLGIPLAHHVKALGRVGISLGGHLQVLFGVQGKRWRDDEQWQRDYVNETWIDMPENERIRVKGWVADGGAYW